MDEHPGKQSIPLTLNKYLYGNADPVNNIDPSGNLLLTDVGASTILQSMGRITMGSGSAGITTAVKVRVALYVAMATIGTAVVTDIVNKQLIKNCIIDSKTKGSSDCKPSMSILIVGENNNEVRDHIGDAQADFHPSIVTRRAMHHDRGWLERHKGPGKACDNASKDCDEYPMAIHMEGGESNSPSLRSVDSSQNSSVGSLARWLHSKCGVPVDGKYMVKPMKGLPVSGYICGR